MRTRPRTTTPQFVLEGSSASLPLDQHPLSPATSSLPAPCKTSSPLDLHWASLQGSRTPPVSTQRPEAVSQAARLHSSGHAHASTESTLAPTTRSYMTFQAQDGGRYASRQLASFVRVRTHAPTLGGRSAGVASANNTPSALVAGAGAGAGHGEEGGVVRGAVAIAAARTASRLSLSARQPYLLEPAPLVAGYEEGLLAGGSALCEITVAASWAGKEAASCGRCSSSSAAGGGAYHHPRGVHRSLHPRARTARREDAEIDAWWLWQGRSALGGGGTGGVRPASVAASAAAGERRCRSRCSGRSA